ncbi:DUF4082 domain-containing protein [Actinomadura sp. NEAU-AAG7]|uniref:DUF4082 domain-containing protein n=1 Tax=Actinomadura sp. NEAU-AAG7 TaxID=2839640 RepID=UPI001BE3FC04|nr:DUF4082 domain-containing protein [Actinomadura sp. NEAU-AAG7]MBT2209020.1 DUF4082 domain-containing protein [Actinomadura sp. NEAU-AAG7]
MAWSKVSWKRRSDKPRAKRRTRRSMVLFALVAALVATGLAALAQPPVRAAAGPCETGGNPVACENSKPGSPSSEWEKISGGGQTIEGFSANFSVNVGQQVQFKVNTPARSYSIGIYRMGYYGGAGARKVATVNPSAALPQRQPGCLTDDATGLIDCGGWGVSASWQVPADAVSGVYFAHIVRTDGTDDDNHIVFVVRDDASHSELLFKTSDTTWQAYNRWGGNSLYFGDSTAAPGRAVKVSYNRPFDTRESTPWGRDFVFANEYPMIRFLEANGYDVSYMAGADVDQRGSLLRNHKAFMSVGHDEYWSGAERANVEAARDAGVHLAFLSGNEVFWKTRWENDRAGSAFRTLVTYKETRANAKTDPTPTWTGSWRDPRFSPPADGGRPENGLTGTIWTVNCCGVALKVPAADGKMRLWRGTAVAGQAAGATMTLADQTVGYEWDEDLDNGARPAGVVRMSTTTADVPEKLIDYGTNVAPGRATHSLTLYRAPSGALVFGAGTVQWSWGLDAVHDGPSEAPSSPDPNMRQATVNLFADMGAQPYQLQAGLTRATASADHSAPVSTVTSPAPGTQIVNGRTVTVTGTASDAGGGQVGGVEVSTDGGATWHPATGRGTWTYKWDATGNGPVAIRTRAVDDSGNLEVPGAGTSVAVACPCRLFGDSAVPAVPSDSDTASLEAGVKFKSAVSGWVTGVRFYKGTGNTGTHTGSLWKSDGTRLAATTFTNETASGWQTAEFPTPVQVDAGATYVVSYFAPNGHYSADPEFFSLNPYVRPPLTAPKAQPDDGNGVYRSGASGFPNSTYKGGNYYVDPVFVTVKPPDTMPPTVVDNTPYAGSSSVKTSVKPSVTFSEPIQAGSPTLTVKNGTASIAGTTSLDASRTVLTFTPSAALPAGTKLTVTAGGGRDDAGNAMQTYGYSFTTARPTPQPGVCPCSIWADETAPAIEGVNDPNELEVGVRFTADTDGFVKGVRFYKGRNNDGTHIGTLWTGTGQQLANATFSGESTLGWQEVTFSTPVRVTAGITYVASYHTTKGWYSADYGGLSRAVANPPLTALADGGGGGDGVYKYGARGFPNLSSGSTNYWVDVVFSPPPDTTPPTVASRSPGGGATSVPSSAKVSATFNEAVRPGTATFTVAGPGGQPVAGGAALDASGRVLTFTPSAGLAAATTYTATVGGAKDIAGNTMSGTTQWSFTTSGACPCTLFASDAAPATPSSGDGNALEAGVKFAPDQNGWISGVRFYKGAGNTGTHTGSLWKTDGTRLATGTFANETTSGWQTMTFSAPVPVTAGVTYIASYFAPKGNYSADGGYFGAAYENVPLRAPSDDTASGNGVYAYSATSRFPNQTYGAANYWVDPMFSTVAPGDTAPPTAEAVDPVDGATSVPRAAHPSATFDEAVQGATVRFTLTGPGGVAVPGSVGYDPATRTSVFTPAAPLDWRTRYTARVQDAKDLAGNTQTTAKTWSFTTAKQTTPGTCPCSVWTDEAAPQLVDDDDPASVELGMKFRADSDGWVTGVRFYKGANNTGTHTGSLWKPDGTRLATATFGGESAAGWQEVAFSTPVQVTAGTTYVVSYLAPNGHYSANVGGFENAGVDAPPLHALRDGDDGPNGVYAYGPGGFPGSGSSSNYWVDVVFTSTHP